LLIQTNQYFKKALGSLYSPHEHWTSSLRTYAGFPDPAIDVTARSKDADPESLTPSVDISAFTFVQHLLCREMTTILLNHGYKDAALWMKTPPSYHFEVAVSAEGGKESFVIDVSTIERVSYKLILLYENHPLI
jgi:hypothetical protein